jgi:hypothetical protein
MIAIEQALEIAIGIGRARSRQFWSEGSEEQGRVIGRLVATLVEPQEYIL